MNLHRCSIFDVSGVAVPLVELTPVSARYIKILNHHSVYNGAILDPAIEIDSSESTRAEEMAGALPSRLPTGVSLELGRIVPRSSFRRCAQFLNR